MDDFLPGDAFQAMKTRLGPRLRPRVGTQVRKKVARKEPIGSGIYRLVSALFGAFTDGKRVRVHIYF